MTGKLIILFIGLFFWSPTTPTYNQYEGRRVGKLLKDIHNDIESKYFIDEPPGILVGIKLYLKDGSKLSVYLKRLRYVEKENMTRGWDWEAIKKERIDEIELD